VSDDLFEVPQIECTILSSLCLRRCASRMLAGLVQNGPSLMTASWNSLLKWFNLLRALHAALYRCGASVIRPSPRDRLRLGHTQTYGQRIYYDRGHLSWTVVWNSRVLGLDRHFRLLFVVHVEVEEDAFRIISTRRATPEEWKLYED
jgi:hypothetical protein